MTPSRYGDARVRPRRVAVLSVHTSPLEQPGTGDAGGMNVYVVETSQAAGRRSASRSRSSPAPPAATCRPVVELAPGVTVRHLIAGPFEGLSKEDLPAQLCALTSGVLRAEAQHEPGWYDVVHSHYWLSGQVGWLASERWGVPLVHTAHTLAKVKNLALAEGDAPEPLRRVVGEQQVVAAADRLVANTADEARQLVDLYDADAERVVTVAPGVDLEHFRPGEASGARTRLGVPPDAVAAAVRRAHPAAQGARRPAPRRRADAASRTRPSATASSSRSSAGPSGTGLAEPDRPAGPRARARHRRPRPLRDAAGRPDATGCATGTSPPTSSPSPATTSPSGWSPSRRRPAAPRSSRPTSAGCAPPSATASPGCSSPGHGADDWAAALDPRRRRPRRGCRAGAVAHAAGFSWGRTADGLLATYRDALADRRRRCRWRVSR